MGERVIEKQRRFVPIAEYQRQTGLSYATVKHMIDTNQVRVITTESGKQRIDTQEPGVDEAVVINRLDCIERAVAALCRQFNVNFDKNGR